jgi:hypothetical protein
MRRLILLGLLLLPTAAQAQETYSFSATASQVTTLNQGIADINAGTCATFALAATCTQAQACTAANAPGGAACTAAQARNANVRIWPNSQPGREEFIQFYWLLSNFNGMKSSIQSKDAQSYCTWYRAQTQTVKDSECTKTGRSANCEMCPS